MSLCLTDITGNSTEAQKVWVRKLNDPNPPIVISVKVLLNSVFNPSCFNGPVKYKRNSKILCGFSGYIPGVNVCN